MELRQDMSAELRRRFQTGRICLDFTHTGGDGEFAKWELLHQPSDAARFLGAVLGVDPPMVRRNDIADVLELRSAVTVLARTRVAGALAPPSAISDVNRAASRPPLVRALSATCGLELHLASTAQALSTLARDAVDLFSSPIAERIRVCDADDCGLLFVDASRPGSRRWCSMEWCGDRQKKRIARRPTVEGAET